MSFLTRYDSLIIGGSTAPGGFLAGSPSLVSEVPSITPEGWDTLTQIYALRIASLTAEAAAALFPIGQKLGARNWWIQGCKPASIAPGVWQLEIDLKGWAYSKPFKVKVGSTLQQSGNNASAGGAAYNTTNPSLSVSYLVPDVDAAEVIAHMELIGTAIAAEDLPVPMPEVTPWIPIANTGDPRPNPWLPADIILPCTYNSPNGWILNSSDQERLVGCTAAIITDTYGYKPMYSPA